MSASLVNAVLKIDPQRPWLGLDSFTEGTKEHFFGREAEISAVLRKLRKSPILLLYGSSGRGKTSLLQAGVIPRLRKAGKRPEFHRLTYGKDCPSPLEQILGVLQVPDKPANPDQNRFALPEDAASRLWLHLHGRNVNGAVTHLVLDQFEEVFTLGEADPVAQEEVRAALVIILQGMVPAPVRSMIAAHESFLRYFDPDSTPMQVILSMREDYVYALNRWRGDFPMLTQNDFELHDLNGPAAFEAVYRPGNLGPEKLVTEETAARIVRFTAGTGAKVPLEEISAVPPILSLLCYELNESRLKDKAAQIAFSEEDDRVEDILDQFYQRCLYGLPTRVRQFIEEQLVSSAGYRVQCDEEAMFLHFTGRTGSNNGGAGNRAAHFANEEEARRCASGLVRSRLLTRIGDDKHPKYELTHEILCRPAMKGKAARQERQAASKKLRDILTGVLIAAVLIFGVLTWYAVQQTFDANAAKVNADRERAKAIASAADATEVAIKARTAEKDAGMVAEDATRKKEQLQASAKKLTQASGTLLEVFGSVNQLQNTLTEIKEGDPKSFREKFPKIKVDVGHIFDSALREHKMWDDIGRLADQEANPEPKSTNAAGPKLAGWMYVGPAGDKPMTAFQNVTQGGTHVPTNNDVLRADYFVNVRREPNAQIIGAVRPGQCVKVDNQKPQFDIRWVHATVIDCPVGGSPGAVPGSQAAPPSPPWAPIDQPAAPPTN